MSPILAFCPCLQPMRIPCEAAVSELEFWLVQLDRLSWQLNLPDTNPCRVGRNVSWLQQPSPFLLLKIGQKTWKKMSTGGSYNSERPPSVDVDYSADPASGSFFSTEFKKWASWKNLGNRFILDLFVMGLIFFLSMVFVMNLSFVW